MLATLLKNFQLLSNLEVFPKQLGFKFSSLRFSQVLIITTAGMKILVPSKDGYSYIVFIQFESCLVLTVSMSYNQNLSIVVSILINFNN